jgi:hypothetical protein
VLKGTASCSMAMQLEAKAKGCSCAPNRGVNSGAPSALKMRSRKLGIDLGPTAGPPSNHSCRSTLH